jgi:putative redox protein
MEFKLFSRWTDGLTFETYIDDTHKITMDARAEVGGRNLGPSPKKVLLASMTGCTGMDVVSLFQKMRIDVKELKVSAAGQLTEDHPIYFDKIHLIYEVSGTDLDKEKIKKAVELSQNRYCGVSHMLSKSAEITYEIKYIE